jgi:hypothetical protein
MNVWGLRQDGIGLAAQLDDSGMEFAEKLQHAHDDAAMVPGKTMEELFRGLGQEYNLTWPE